MTAKQISSSLLAIPAFLPSAVCTGYLAAWFTDLHGFRRRSLAERLFWSVPLSLSISTIASVLMGKFISLGAASFFFLACGVIWLAVLGAEWFKLRRAGRRLTTGWRPQGGVAVAMAIVWVMVAILSLVDIQKGSQLYVSIATYDHAPRVSWTESVLRTGVPPANPLYHYQHAAGMRYYYFWNVVCAAEAKMTHLPVRAIFIASCVWAGFALAALIGLYLKHFIPAGVRLRKQFLLCISLLMVTGLDICVTLWNVVVSRTSLPADLEWWSTSQITSWLDSLLWVPHHIASFVCCMFAFLLAWMPEKNRRRWPAASMAFIACAMASAFGLSIYVAFAYFLVMLVWAFRQVFIERKTRPALLLAAGGAGAAVLLLPYLRELTQASSGLQRASLFKFAIREMFPPDSLLASNLFQHLATTSPAAARNLANLILLAPGYAVELGFYLVVFLIYLVPAWRGRTPLTDAQGSLLTIAAVTLAIVSFLRSSVLAQNDFGWRAALLLQFPLLVLGSEIVMGWRIAERKSTAASDWAGLARNTPQWLRSIAGLMLVIGVFSSVCQALNLRFDIPLVEAHLRMVHSPDAGRLTHNAYISSVGYVRLNASIPRDAIVQFNPAVEPYMLFADLIGIDHQIAIVGDKPFCGAELGGDPAGCPAMATAIDALYKGAAAEQARATCREFGIHFLVTRVYDPAWNYPGDWVWSLPPVVSDREFRALDCRQ